MLTLQRFHIHLITNHPSTFILFVDFFFFCLMNKKTKQFCNTYDLFRSSSIRLTDVVHRWARPQGKKKNKHRPDDDGGMTHQSELTLTWKKHDPDLTSSSSVCHKWGFDASDIVVVSFRRRKLSRKLRRILSILRGDDRLPCKNQNVNMKIREIHIFPRVRHLACPILINNVIKFSLFSVRLLFSPERDAPLGSLTAKGIVSITIIGTWYFQRYFESENSESLMKACKFPFGSRSSQNLTEYREYSRWQWKTKYRRLRLITPIKNSAIFSSWYTRPDCKE